MFRTIRVYGLTAFIIAGVWTIGVLRQGKSPPPAFEQPDPKLVLMLASHDGDTTEPAPQSI